MVWAEPYRLQLGQEREWHVLDQTGHWIGYAFTPRSLRVLDITSDRAVGVVADSLGVQTVRVLELTRQAR
jgi:hypothetical protein